MDASFQAPQGEAPRLLSPGVELLAPQSTEVELVRSAERPLSFVEERIAQFAAEGRLSLRDIASVVGLGRRHVERALSDPAVKARAEALQKEFAFASSLHGIARREVRLERLQGRADALDRVVQERAAQADPFSPFALPGAESQPGAATGLLTRTEKAVGSGENQTFVEEWELDRGLLAELRAVEEAAAKETGQWSEKKTIEVTGKAYIGVDLSLV